MLKNSIGLKFKRNYFFAISLAILFWLTAFSNSRYAGLKNISRNGSSAIVEDSIKKTKRFKQKDDFKKDTFRVNVPNKDKDFFFVKFKDSLQVEKSVYDSVSKIIAISDIEGNFNALYSFLISNKVIDKNYNWIFGNGHVVFLGDFVDRGNASTQVLWFIYKLEQEAAKHAGKVHYILGNHEILNIQGTGYSDNKFINGKESSSEEIEFDEAQRYLYSARSEIGKWLRTKNSVEKIGNYIFVHGGLSPKIISFKPDLDKINNTIRDNIAKDLYNFPGRNRFANFLIGRDGPLWFRGMAMTYKYYNKISESEFKELQNYFNCPKIVIGHTNVREVQTDFSGSLFKIDVIHGQEKFSGGSKGLFIENNIEYVADETGSKLKLEKRAF